MLFSQFSKDVNINSPNQHPSFIWDNSLWMQRMAIVWLPLSVNALFSSMSFYWGKKWENMFLWDVKGAHEKYSAKVSINVKSGPVPPVTFVGGLPIWFFAYRDSHAPGRSVTQTETWPRSFTELHLDKSTRNGMPMMGSCFQICFLRWAAVTLCSSGKHKHTHTVIYENIISSACSNSHSAQQGQSVRIYTFV